jgi:hypothetical protein
MASTGNVEFDAVGTGKAYCLREPELGGMTLDPRKEGCRLDIAEDRHALPPEMVILLAHRSLGNKTDI